MPTLTDLDVRNSPPGEYTDGEGLILVVKASRRPGGKPRRSWVLRIVDQGRRRKIGLGAYPIVSLGKARQKAQDARRALAAGVDPSVTAKRRAGLAEAAKALTLGQAIDSWRVKAAPKYKSAKSEAIRDRVLQTHFASLREQDVASITATDVAGILRGLRPQTAIKACGVIRAVFDFAATTLEPHGVLIVNPADPRRLKALGWAPKSVKASIAHPALDWREAPAFMAALASLDSIEARCLSFIIYTAARAGAARAAKWANIDLEKRLWAAPAQDLKDSKHRTAPFVVPLSDAAIELLKGLPRKGVFLFSDAAGRPIGEHAVIKAVRAMHRIGRWLDPKTGKPATAHGFRATFRTWAKAKRLDREIAELNLGHVFYAASESPYARDDEAVLDLRRGMLDQWGQFCSGGNGEVIPFPGRA
jgi:integrase